MEAETEKGKGQVRKIDYFGILREIVDVTHPSLGTESDSTNQHHFQALSNIFLTTIQNKEQQTNLALFNLQNTKKAIRSLIEDQEVELYVNKQRRQQKLNNIKKHDLHEFMSFRNPPAVVALTLKVLFFILSRRCEKKDPSWGQCMKETVANHRVLKLCSEITLDQVIDRPHYEWALEGWRELNEIEEEGIARMNQATSQLFAWIKLLVSACEVYRKMRGNYGKIQELEEEELRLGAFKGLSQRVSQSQFTSSPWVGDTILSFSAQTLTPSCPNQDLLKEWSNILQLHMIPYQPNST